MISLICASNNEKVLNDMLIASLKEQTFNDYELIVIDSKIKGFNSAAETLNYGASISKGDILVFVHQDVRFLNNDALEKIHQYSIDFDFSVAGVAGTTGELNFEVSSSVTMGDNHRQAGICISSITKAYSLDEVLLIVKKDKFDGFIDLGNTWHFYGVEYSIRH